MSAPLNPGRAAARIATYLRLTPTAHTLGGEIAYSEEFRSNDWPRGCYAPTRSDMETLLAELADLAEWKRRVTEEVEEFEAAAKDDPKTPRAACLMIANLRRAMRGEPR